MKLLEVSSLSVSFPTEDGMVDAVRGLSFAVDEGQTLGVMGESGSSKSVATQTIVGLTRGARIRGQAMFDGQDHARMRGEHSLEPGGPTLDAIDARHRQQRTTLHHTHAMSGRVRYLSDPLSLRRARTC